MGEAIENHKRFVDRKFLADLNAIIFDSRFEVLAGRISETVSRLFGIEKSRTISRKSKYINSSKRTFRKIQNSAYPALKYFECVCALIFLHCTSFGEFELCMIYERENAFIRLFSFSLLVFNLSHIAFVASDENKKGENKIN